MSYRDPQEWEEAALQAEQAEQAALTLVAQHEQVIGELAEVAKVARDALAEAEIENTRLWSLLTRVETELLESYDQTCSRSPLCTHNRTTERWLRDVAKAVSHTNTNTIYDLLDRLQQETR